MFVAAKQVLKMLVKGRASSAANSVLSLYSRSIGRTDFVLFIILSSLYISADVELAGGEKEGRMGEQFNCSYS